MVVVDPFLIPIPREYLRSKAEREYHERLINTINQLRIRTGGAEDSVEDNSTRESYPWNLDVNEPQVTPSPAFFDTSIVFRQFNGVSTRTNYKAIPWDWVNATSGCLITFPQYPLDGDELIIRNGDGSNVRLNGNGNKINGSITGNIRQKTTSIRFKYFLSEKDWFAI